MTEREATATATATATAKTTAEADPPCGMTERKAKAVELSPLR
jgi:hypothetical protein